LPTYQWANIHVGQVYRSYQQDVKLSSYPCICNINHFTTKQLQYPYRHSKMQQFCPPMQGPI